MKKIDHAVILMTTVCVILGAIIGIQIKTVRRQTNTVDMQRVNELSLELKKMTEEKDALTNKLEEAQERLKEYEESTNNESNQIRLLKEELENTRMAAGMVEVTGRGITVTLNDNNKARQGVDTNAFLVHAEDILSAINELKVAGAEAISINGQRITTSSSIRCAGSVVNVNGEKIATPFVISAIGDPEVLEASLKFPGGVVDSLSPWGIEIIIKKNASITIPAYNQAIQFKEAVPAAQKED